MTRILSDTPRKFSCYVVGALMLLGTAFAQTPGTDSAPQVIEIHAKKFGYDPSEITLHKGQTYKLHLTSDDVKHSLRIKALAVNATAEPGKFDDVLVTPQETGDFKGDCGVFCGSGHLKMAMTVHVVQ